MAIPLPPLLWISSENQYFTEFSNIIMISNDNWETVPFYFSSPKLIMLKLRNTCWAVTMSQTLNALHVLSHFIPITWWSMYFLNFMNNWVFQVLGSKWQSWHVKDRVHAGRRPLPSLHLLFNFKIPEIYTVNIVAVLNLLFLGTHNSKLQKSSFHNFDRKSADLKKIMC